MNSLTICVTNQEGFESKNNIALNFILPSSCKPQITCDPQRTKLSDDDPCSTEHGLLCEPANYDAMIVPIEKRKWHKRTIRWASYPGIPLDIAYSVVGLIMKYVDLTLLRVTDGHEDIQISLVPLVHQLYEGSDSICPKPFEPKSLGHVHRSTELGRPVVIHLNMTLDWDMGKIISHYDTIGNEKKTYSFFMVLLHEMLHSLGLEHSLDYRSVMYGNYNRRIHGDWTKEAFNLPEVDIINLQSLYSSLPRWG